MKKLSNLAAVTGAFLAVAALILKYTSTNRINGENLTLSAELALLSGSSLIFVALFYQWASRKQFHVHISRDISLPFWLTCTLFLGMFSFVVINSASRNSRQNIVREFHKIYHAAGGYKSFYLGIQSAQYPADNWVMQELISELKPDFMVETGTAAGGTALFYADILEKINSNGKVITVDIDPHDPHVTQFKSWRERVTYIQGSSVSPEVVELIKKRVDGQKTIVTLDSLHWKPHVLRELELYSPLVPVNSYIVVQDTQFTGHPIPEGSEGPWEAVEEFLKTNKDFIIDHNRERHLVTANPSGYLKRIK
jgi:cephalosporin hydroxylase